MSILIKGMQMPKECLDCPMCDINDDCVLQKDERFDTWEEQKKGCPLVEVPESHGRLIDASYKVDMPFYDDEYEEHSMRTVTVEELLMMADNDVPTVIEAEGSEDNA